MNKKERRLALATALQSAASDMIVVESLAGQVEDKKTKTLLSMLEKVRQRRNGTGSSMAQRQQQHGGARPHTRMLRGSSSRADDAAVHACATVLGARQGGMSPSTSMLYPHQPSTADEHADGDIGSRMQSRWNAAREPCCCTLPSVHEYPA